MKTIRIEKGCPSVGELLSIARNEAVRIVSEDGDAFILEEAEDFDREAAELGSSEPFMRFLKERADAPGVIPIENLMKELESAGE